MALRRTTAVTVGAATLAWLLAGLAGAEPAGAATSGPGSYQGSASASALVVSIGGQKLTTGASAASSTSAPTATSSGEGELLPALVGARTATESTAGATDALPQSCGTPSGLAIPASLTGLVSLGIACGSATASVTTAGLPSASGNGSAASVSIGLGSLLDQVVTSGAPLAGTLQGVLGELPTLPSGGLPLGSLLTQLGASSTSATGLLSVTAGTTTSSVATTGTVLTSSMAASGATVGLLPGVGVSGGPLLSVQIGASKAAATLDRQNAAATATDAPALVSVTVGTPATGAHTVSIAPGRSQTFLAGTPLASTVSVGSGTVSQGTGYASASATGVTLDLAQGIDGGIDVDLASGTASVGGTAPAVVPPMTLPYSASASSAPSVIPDVTTVHTGEPWGGSLPVVGAAFALGLALFYRRRFASLVPALGRIGGVKRAAWMGGLRMWIAGRRHKGTHGTLRPDAPLRHLSKDPEG